MSVGPPRIPSSLALLQADLDFIEANHRALVIKHALHNPTSDEECYVNAALALWGTLIEHCRAVTLLLRTGLIESARSVNRSAYETAIHLNYLATVGNKHENARLYEARLLHEYIAVVPPALSVETSKRLEALPADVRARAIQNKKDRREWTGKTLAEMAEALRVRQHRGFFAVQSWATHGHSGLHDMLRIESPEEGVTFWRQDLDLQDVEMIAMHTRRTVLWPAYHLATRDFYGAAPTLPTPPPPTG